MIERAEHPGIEDTPPKCAAASASPQLTWEILTSQRINMQSLQANLCDQVAALASSIGVQLRFQT